MAAPNTTTDATAGQKRKPGPLDGLPYQRKYIFRRSSARHISFEERLHEFVRQHAPGGQSSGSADRPASHPDGSRTPVTISLGRVIAKETGKHIILPVMTEALLEGQEHTFEPRLPAALGQKLRERLLEEQKTWQAASGSARRWADVKVTERQVAKPSPPQDARTVFSPGGNLHYQLCVGLQEQPVKAENGGGILEEARFRFAKDKSPDGMFWAVAILTDAEEASGEGQERMCSIELSVNPRLLWSQELRMASGKAHAFSLALRDLLRNARSLLVFLCGQEEPGEEPLYYPKMIESSANVRQFYCQKAQENAPKEHAPKSEAKQHAPRTAGKSVSDNIRRYNNLVKTLLIEQFIDEIPSPASVLDLGCGRGQDVNKYSGKHRKVKIEKYVGIDFAEEAIEEARRRHQSAADYPAVYYALDLTDDKTFQQLEQDGHTTFDAVSAQFVLHYLARSEECMRTFFKRIHGILRPGGRLIATIPNCDQLGELYGRAIEFQAPGETAKVSNSLYSVSFEGAAQKLVSQTWGECLDEAFGQGWGLPYRFSLADAVDNQEEYNVPWEALEAILTEIGFNVVLDAGFSEILSEYSTNSKFYNGTFRKQPEFKELSDEEEEVFGLYSAFVLERV